MLVDGVLDEHVEQIMARPNVIPVAMNFVEPLARDPHASVLDGLFEVVRDRSIPDAGTAVYAESKTVDISVFEGVLVCVRLDPSFIGEFGIDSKDGR